MCNNSLCSLFFPRGEQAHRRPILIGNQSPTGQAWCCEPRESAELTGICLLWPIHWCKAKGYLIPLYVYICIYIYILCILQHQGAELALPADYYALTYTHHLLGAQTLSFDCTHCCVSFKLLWRFLCDFVAE